VTRFDLQLSEAPFNSIAYNSDRQIALWWPQYPFQS